MPMRENSLLLKVLCLVLLGAQARGYAAGIGGGVISVTGQTLDFPVYWPPVDPALKPGPKDGPLLHGQVKLRIDDSLGGRLLRLQISLTRPSDVASREVWNSRLAFPEYDWMRYVRVWDTGHQWLWPNLPYLLRLHGQERVERYGGVDPGKGVDNDYAAVLIRKYDVLGIRESADTKEKPLVSAEWHPEDARTGNGQTLVHTALSDTFTLHAGSAPDERQGQARVWLIYADFMGAKPPANWPSTPEYAGGILGFFKVHWMTKTTDTFDAYIVQTAPKAATGFDWERWTEYTKAAPDTQRTAKLMDRLELRLLTNRVWSSSNLQRLAWTNFSRLRPASFSPMEGIEAAERINRLQLEQYRRQHQEGARGDGIWPGGFGMPLVTPRDD
jgi:hypothetical protein